jgi:hypothetical protein
MAFRWGSDPVSIGAIAECGAARFDRFAYARNFVRREVVDDDDVIALERWQGTLFDIRQAGLSGH